MLLFEGGWAVTKSCQTWENFLQNKLLNSPDSFTPKAAYALKEIFLSCHVASRIATDTKITEYKTGEESGVTELMDTSSIFLSAQDIVDPNPGNLMHVFFKALRERTKLGTEEILDIIKQHDCNDGDDSSAQKSLHFEGFFYYVMENIKSDKRLVWKAFHACGYDFNHRR